MIQWKVYAVLTLTYVSFSYLQKAHGDPFVAVVSALKHPAAKTRNDGLQSPTSKAITEWKESGFRSVPESGSDRMHVQEDYEAKNSLDGTDTLNDSRIGRRPVESVSSSVKLAKQKFCNGLDEMDKLIIRNTLPLVALTSIVPVLQSLDLFWVNQLGDTRAVSAQSAANTLYQFSFGLISFLPNVTATLVSRHFAKNNFEETGSTVVAALLFGAMASSAISFTIFANPSRYLGAILKDGNAALSLSSRYMKIRCLSLIPQTVAYICFAAFRGMLDYKVCIKISLLASIVDIVLKPVLIHVFRLGILGSAISSLLCESITAICYMRLMKSKGFFVRKKLFILSLWSDVTPLLKGCTLQARSFAMHSTNLVVARKVQSLDDSGVVPAAFSLAMQTFFTGGTIIYAMGMSAQTLYPNAVAKCKEEDKKMYAKSLIRRLLGRSFGVGTVISCIQALLFPIILRATPLSEVRQAAVFPLVTAIVLQGVNGVACIGEAIMVGNGKFAFASIVLVVASIGYTGSLQLFPHSWGVNGVSIAFIVFNSLRLIGFGVFLPQLVNSKELNRSSSEQYRK